MYISSAWVSCTKNVVEFFQGKKLVTLIFKQVFASTPGRRADALWKYNLAIHSTTIEHHTHVLNRSQHKHLEGPLLSPNIIKCAWLQSCILFEGFHYYSGKDFILQCLKSHHPKELRENHLVKKHLSWNPLFCPLSLGAMPAFSVHQAGCTAKPEPETLYTRVLPTGVTVGRELSHHNMKTCYGRRIRELGDLFELIGKTTNILLYVTFDIGARVQIYENMLAWTLFS